LSLKFARSSTLVSPAASFESAICLTAH
jgi:hypothetical protein